MGVVIAPLDFRAEHQLKHFSRGLLDQRNPIPLESPHGLYGIRGVHAFAANSVRTFSFTCSGVNGLRIYPLAPQERACVTCDSLPSVVIITTGTPLPFSTSAR